VPASVRPFLIVVAAATLPLADLQGQTAVRLIGTPTQPRAVMTPDGDGHTADAATGAAAVRTFVRTPNGNWRTVIAATRTAPARTYVFVPSTKVEPNVTVDVTLAQDAARPAIRYRYRIANGKEAKQALARLFIGTGQVVSVEGIPPAWRLYEPQRAGAVSLSGPLRGQVPQGLPPGTGSVVELTSTALPGIVTVRAAGDTVGAVEVPAGLSHQQYLDLSQISRQATVDVPAVGAAIPAGAGEPGLGFDGLLSRVRLHYADAVQRYGHPHAGPILRELDAMAFTGATPADPRVRRALSTIRQLAQQPVTGDATTHLSRALDACAAALLTGAFPVR
jgi:hypothetical protein